MFQHFLKKMFFVPRKAENTFSKYAKNELKACWPNRHSWELSGYLGHASALTAAAKIQPIEFQNQRDVTIRSLAFLPVDGRPHPVSVSMILGSFGEVNNMKMVQNYGF